MSPMHFSLARQLWALPQQPAGLAMQILGFWGSWGRNPCWCVLHEVPGHALHWDLCWTRMLVGMQGELTVGMELGQGALLGPA